MKSTYCMIWSYNYIIVSICYGVALHYNDILITFYIIHPLKINYVYKYPGKNILCSMHTEILIITSIAFLPWLDDGSDDFPFPFPFPFPFRPVAGLVGGATSRGRSSSEEGVVGGGSSSDTSSSSRGATERNCLISMGDICWKRNGSKTLHQCHRTM